MGYFAEVEALLGNLVQSSGSGLVVLAGGATAYVCLHRSLKTLEKRRYLPARLVNTLRRSALWLILLASALIFLQSIGVLHSVITAVTGVFALVAIGFVAVWSVLSNTLCSLILMAIRPFRVGDTVGFPPDDYRGKVVNFNMIFTTLETEDGLLLQVPNNTFFQRPIMREKGSWHIGLQDQLYERGNACGQEPDSDEEKAESRRAA
jgi:small-conductance mechanosensitive channel